jgi:hypothetical protein
MPVFDLAKVGWLAINAAAMMAPNYCTVLNSPAALPPCPG